MNTHIYVKYPHQGHYPLPTTTTEAVTETNLVEREVYDFQT